MTDALHIPARVDAPIACDLGTAEDTPEERLGEYSRLFERALLRRERRAGGVVFAFRAGAGTRGVVEDLARREAACCPFLEYRVETHGDEVTWTLLDVTGRAGVEAILDAFHALPNTPARFRVPPPTHRGAS